MTYDPRSPDYYDLASVEKELARVTELCDGCRRCYRLCTSFDYMLDEAVDRNEGDLSKITSQDYRKIVDLCWQCKLCFNHCPYTPPHKWAIDFPRLLLRAKAARVRAEGITRQDRWLANVDVLGPAACASAPLSNWANESPLYRRLLEAVAGIEKTRNLPRFHRQTFARWFRKRGGRIQEGRPLAFFYSCSVNYNEPQVGRDAVSVLEKNGCTVTCPKQVCCGMPYLDAGDVEGAARNARRNLDSLFPLAKAGLDIVVPQPTCSYVLKKDYPMLAPGPEAELVASRTRDLFEYLAGRAQEGSLATDFSGTAPGKVAYQVPCHLRAQNMGFKTKSVLELVPGTKVEVVEKCTAMDGTWAMKKEYFPLSMRYAKKAVAQMESSSPDRFTTDCTLSALQIEAASGKRPSHPIALLRDAYGIAEEH